MRVKVKVIGSGTLDDPYRVNLPTYIIDVQRDADGNPILTEDGTPKIQDLTRISACWVLIPDDEVDELGRIDEKRIREKYGGKWADFRREEVEVT